MSAVLALGEANKTMEAGSLLLSDAVLAYTDNAAQTLIKTCVQELVDARKDFLDALKKVGTGCGDPLEAQTLSNEVCFTRFLIFANVFFKADKYEAKSKWLMKNMKQLAPAVLAPAPAQEMKRARLDFKDLTRATELKGLSVGQKLNVQPNLLSDLSEAAQQVNNALVHLLEATKAAENSVCERCFFHVLTLFSSEHGSQP